MIVSAEEFVRLRTSEDPEEYTRAAREPAKEAVWLAIIAGYPEMRVWVARNKTIPASVVKVLAADTDSAVREAIAMRRSTPYELLRVLAADEDPGVRHAVAMNRRVGRELLQTLAVDADADVAEAASGRLLESPPQGRDESRTEHPRKGKR